MAFEESDEAEDEVATASLLLNCAGVQRNIFPKTYHTRVSRGFIAYLIFLTVFLLGYTVFVYYNPVGNDDGTESGIGIPLWYLLVFDVSYLALLFGFIFSQVPRKVVRENGQILIVFCCRTRVVPIESLVEIRIVRRRRNRCSRKECKLCLYPWKCFWGYPTNFDRNIIVVTDTTCNNYFFCLKEMEEFMADNWPEPDTVDDHSASIEETKPQVLGSCDAI
eukprot:TRINITY_DN44084_c0_g1_i1.p2 TRINITY_DN44084_c0_g1~~TRINITY_DN44084_c0_g1_i1.p2  ORF type:complete len:221 (+),score=39.66 TRINITY_DN44084_c0_g1_i1:81-743(+)